MDSKKSGQSFFDRPTTSSAPRRSKWQDDEYDRRDDRERGGRGRRPQLGADGLTPADPRLEEELFGNHSNTGINFDKYQVRLIFLFISRFGLLYTWFVQLEAFNLPHFGIRLFLRLFGPSLLHA